MHALTLLIIMREREKMKKINLILCLLLYLSCLFSVTLEVSADGTKPYQSIQSAINQSSNGDIIKVYPGTYRENLNFNGHSLTLKSLYSETQDTTYISNTRIIGLPNRSAIYIENVQNAIIDGFTIMNNENRIEAYYHVGGGGICIYNSNAVVKNNIITKCLSGFSGGGIVISSNPQYHNLSLENNKIFNNKSYNSGGGIAIMYKSVVNFSQTNRNSIYENYAPGGKDIIISSVDLNTDVYLDKATLAINTYDQFFILLHQTTCNEELGNVTVDINQAILTEINHDLYVAPWGNDNNTGLSFQSPLKSIDYASRIIASDSLNPKTIYLAPGTYSKSLNNQEFPIGVKSDVLLIGSGMTETILDIENVTNCMAIMGNKDYKPNNYNLISDLKIINCGNDSLEITDLPAVFVLSKKVLLRNIQFDNNKLDHNNGIALLYSDNAKINNIIVNNGLSSNSSYGLVTYKGGFLTIENFIINNMVANTYECGMVGATFGDNQQIIINNMCVTNSSSTLPQIFQCVTESQYAVGQTYDSYYNNILIANNTSYNTDPYWDSPIVIAGNDANHTYLNNFTIANNRGCSYAFGFFSSNVTANNMILYNPEMPYELTFGCYTQPDLDNCVFNNSYIMDREHKIKYWWDNQDGLTMNNMVDAPSPMFLGMQSDSLDMSMPEYYHLATGSPCINQGVADTSGVNMSSVDLAGNQRVWNDRIDLGCFEYGAPHVSISNQEVPPIISYNLKNYPNPVYTNRTSYTIFSFDYDKKANIEPEIEIFNIKGQKVKTLKTGDSFYDLAQKAGISKDNPLFAKGRNYSVIWDLKEDNNKLPASGVYFYRAKVDGKILQTKKMLIIK